MSVKIQLYKHCEVFISGRLQAIQNTIADLQNALQSETKSSAGDKHETGRAMVQLEREKAGKQLAEALKIKQVLSKLDPEKSTNSIGLGSVVYTSKNNYFIGVSAGEIWVNDQQFYAISPSTPIAQLLMGKTTEDTLVFRGEQFRIEAVL